MVLSGATSSLDDEPYFRLFAKNESPLLSLLCTCTACSFSLFFRLKDLPPFLLYGKELYPIIQCQKISQLSDENVLLLCQILLNVELTEDNIESWQYDSYECYDDLMEFAYTTKFPIARYHDQNIYYDGYFCNTWMDLNVQQFKRYNFSSLDDEPTEQSISQVENFNIILKDNEKVNSIQEDHEAIELPQCPVILLTPQNWSADEYFKAMDINNNIDVKKYNHTGYELIKQVTGNEIFREKEITLSGENNSKLNISRSLYPSGIIAKIMRNLRAFSSSKVKMKLCE